MKIPIRFLTKTLGVLLILFIAGSWTAAGILIAPHPSRAAWPAGLGFSPEEVSFSATDGVVLRGWFLPQPGSAKAILLLHGVDANRGQMLGRAAWLHAAGYNVLLYDAQGQGTSASVHPSFGYAETRDLLGATHWLEARGMTEIGCIGFSQGAATLLLASGQMPASVRAVVAEAPYVTLHQTVDDHFRAFTGLPSGYFGALAVPIAEWELGLRMDDVSPLREIPRLKTPLYLIGGTSDVLAPPAGISALNDAATCEKTLWMVPGAQHTDFFAYAESDYKQRIGDFLRKQLSP